MEIVVILLSCLVLAACSNEEMELKIDYYEKLITNAFAQIKTYKVRQNNSDYFRNSSNTEKVIDYGIFDFIIVGGGTAGSVVASRLSEIESYNVLLLEAGDRDDDLIGIPYYANLLQFSDRNWGYFTTPQKNACYGWEENKCAYPRGKVLGGSGSLNYLLYARGNRENFDKWATLGNPGWSFEDVLPYFKKAENFESNKIDDTYRGFAGPINVAYQEPKEDGASITDSYVEIGTKLIEDYNAEQQLGFSRIQNTVRFGKRNSGATSYVRPSATRHNFNVTLQALVTKILVKNSTKEAYGVRFVKNGQIYQATAKREIILSGGAINTPQLLMLSGIGPVVELKKHGIPVISNLPVGKYLIDHCYLLLPYETNLKAENMPFHKLIKDYLNGKGILTSYQNSVFISYVNTRNISSPVPNIEIVVSLPQQFPKPVPSLTRYTETVKKYLEKIDQRKSMTSTILILNPKSTGTLSLKSNSITDFPYIDLNLLKDPHDLEVLYEGIQIVTKLGKTKAAKKIEAEQLRFDFCNQHVYDSKAYWFCVLRHLATPGLHISSSAKMGPKSDPFAVVDHKLCVYGINNLRVVDTSIMPSTVSGHINAVALMIGEKAADLIKRDHSTE